MTAPAAPPPLERLLEHRAWVRHVARSLVRDDAAADDLAQEVWLEAVARPPREATSPRGWLARALRHNAVDAGRADRRRAAREGAAARHGAERDAADLVAEAEIHRRVVDAVLALDEPARGTLLLRFFDGLPPAAIAARQGVPVETVRTRIRRALADLRRRFDREHGGDRKAWTALLAPLVREPAAPPPDVPHTVPVGLVAAALGVLVGAACVVAVVLAGSGALSGDAAGGPDVARDVAAPGASGTSPPETASRTGRADPVPGTSGARSPEAPEPALPPDTWLAVHVIDEDLRAVAGATLRVTAPADAPEALRAWARRHEVGARGPFPIHGLPADADGWEIRLGAEAPGFTPAEAASVTLESGRTQVTRLVLSRPRTMLVRVTDAATGAPVRGARVVSRTECARRGVDGEAAAAPKGDGWATSAEDGTATLGGLGRGRHVVVADAPRYLPATVSGNSGGADPVALALPPIPFPGRARVVVRAPGGGPVAGAVVTLVLGNVSAAPNVLYATTDASGACTIDDLPPGRHQVFVDPQSVLRGAPGSVPAEVRTRIVFRGCVAGVEVAAGGDASVELGDVAGPAQVVVQVADAAGSPVAGRRVVLQPGLARDTDTDGRARFSDLREGDPFSLEVDGWYGPPVRASADGKPVPWTVGSARVDLVVRGADGRPLPDMTTIHAVSGERQCFVSVGHDGRRRIGVAGAVALSAVPPGTLTLQVWTQGDRAAFAVLDVPESGLVGGPGGRAEVTLRPCGAIRVRTSAPAAALTVRGEGGVAGSMWIDGSTAVRSWVSGPLAAGTYVVEGTLGDAPFRREVEVREGETAVLE